MFSYTDDAIVTSSPTGRHLSTVICRPAAIGPLDWNEHADQVCKVLNELDSKAKASSLSLHLQTVGRVKREQLSGGRWKPVESAYLGPFATAPAVEQVTELEMPIFYSQGIWPLQEEMPIEPVAATSAAERIAELEKQLDDATTKLCAAEMLLKKPIEVTADDVLRLLNLQTDTAIEVDGRTLAEWSNPQ